jgi:hypothetical protein
VNVRLLGAAQIDALDVADAYNQQTVGVGDRFLAAVDALVATLTTLPRLYGRLPRSPAGREVRVALVPGFPIIAVYEVTPNEVLVVSFTHARSTRQTWRRRLP